MRASPRRPQAALGPGQAQQPARLHRTATNTTAAAIRCWHRIGRRAARYHLGRSAQGGGSGAKAVVGQRLIAQVQNLLAQDSAGRPAELAVDGEALINVAALPEAGTGSSKPP